MADNEAPPRATASGADRISTLPDGVREHVLSFLPAHEAVRTTVLARSWRDLWRRSPALRITGWGTIAKFNQFVERLLRLHLSSPNSRRRHPHGDPSAAPAPLDSCHIEFDWMDIEDDEDNVDEGALMDHWFESAVRCRVQELRFFYDHGGDPLTLPNLTLTPSRHLTRLELDGVEVNEGFNLSGFPALRDLYMHDCFLCADEIRSPNLKRLTMDNCDFYFDRRVLICLPSLVSLKMVGCYMRGPVLASMPSLETAIVSIESDKCDDKCSLASVNGCGRERCAGCRDYYDSHVDRTRCLLLRALSEATNLELSAYPEVVVFMRDLKFADSFDNLKTLVLADWFVATDLSALIWFLHHSPILEKLTLRISKVHQCTMNTEGSCKLPELPVASSHLKLVEIKCPEVDWTVIKILKILTSSGVPLEHINVQRSIPSGCELSDVTCSTYFEIYCHLLPEPNTLHKYLKYFWYNDNIYIINLEETILA